jgi:8-oxo-dGTP pyrophosphatase MutT (NUDIX family)
MPDVGKWAGHFALSGLVMARSVLSPVAFGVNALIVDHAGRVLLARHSYIRGLSLPGGGVNRGEPAEHAILREMREELGTLRSDPPAFVGLYSRRIALATNVIALFRFTNAEVDFRPNLEVREIVFVDPANPPAETLLGTARRLAEHVGKSPPSLYW